MHLQTHTMIRQTALLQRARSWRAPDWSIDPGALESAWIEWAEIETIKRALLFAYVSSHHSSQGTYFTYFASWPAEMEMEIELVPLPCDDALWRARSAAEWFAVAHTPSPHSAGVSKTRSRLVQVDSPIETLPNAPKLYRLAKNWARNERSKKVTARGITEDES
ncbi:hypothetical protein B0H14DRAFT_2568266 [Mycena olivaceomarginata]|nr:hypothetical protein B0H14DRAFT_2568266 [Mycena olivaceomarginata]